MQRILILLLISTLFLLAFKNDKTYPKNDFVSPISFPIKLSGTFAELRPNHYHGGLDIKPSKRSRQGDAILSIGEGYISRIIVSSYGYGNGLYVTHPNGYTSVYGHLQKFTPEIADYALKKHYENESFELDLTLSPDELPVSKGKQIGYLGTTGGSLGPHLHFEIRDTEMGNRVNPLFFGFKISDVTKPLMKRLKVYELNHKHETQHTTDYNLKTIGDGRYKLSSDVIEVASNRMAIGLKVFDNISGTSNPNGIYEMSVYQDDSLIYHFKMNTFDYDETRYLNAHLDYAAWKNKEGYIYRGYRLKGNLQNNLFGKLVNDGVIRLSTEPTKVKIIAKDYKGNESSLEFKAKRSEVLRTNNSQTFNYIFPYNEGSIVKRSDIELHFADSSFYEDIYASIQVNFDGSSKVYSPTFHIGEEKIPIHRKYEIRIKPNSNITDSLKSKLYIAKCNNSKDSYVGGVWKDKWLTAKSRTFGDFAVLMDTIAPTITPLEFYGERKPSPRLSFKLADKGTGIKTYNGWVDGQWILMKYDGKKNIIYHTYDESISTGKHNIKIVVTDLRDNETIFESSFVR
ncbi:MAG: M23 family metallopeptidase [Saprospiraceae bacterium]